MATKPQAVKEITEFAWTGINKRGQKVKGLMRADSDRVVRARLRDQGVMPKSVKKKSKSLFGNKKINGGDIALFTRQIATMLSAGVPLLQSLEMVAKGVENPKVRSLMLTIANDVSRSEEHTSEL